MVRKSRLDDGHRSELKKFSTDNGLFPLSMKRLVHSLVKEIIC